eukprot:scaffold5989_cov309-Prasinococcus_capsulatus_cf.AAC.2
MTKAWASPARRGALDGRRCVAGSPLHPPSTPWARWCARAHYKRPGPRGLADENETCACVRRPAAGPPRTNAPGRAAACREAREGEARLACSGVEARGEGGALSAACCTAHSAQRTAHGARAPPPRLRRERD